MLKKKRFLGVVLALLVCGFALADRKAIFIDGGIHARGEDEEENTYDVTSLTDTNSDGATEMSLAINNGTPETRLSTGVDDTPLWETHYYQGGLGVRYVKATDALEFRRDGTSSWQPLEIIE
jgi:hypothetical protein